MFAKPQSEHEWLQQLVGEWSLEHNCQMPDGNSSKAVGKMNCRMIGGMWLVCESSGDSPDDAWSTIITLGFDPAQNQYVGTFIGSMMANIWHYHGVLDAATRRLPLNSKGPRFDGKGIGNYRDTIEIIDADTWLFNGECQLDDGEWLQFMKGKHTRT